MKPPASAQRFLFSMEQILNLLKVGRYKHSTQEYRKRLKESLSLFDAIVYSH